MNTFECSYDSLAEVDTKQLYRAMFSSPLRMEVQANAGRIQQEGRESYRITYSGWEEDYKVSCLPENLMQIVASWPAVASLLFVDIKLSDFDLTTVSTLKRCGVWPRRIEAERQPASIIEHAKRLDDNGFVDAALDIVYDKVDTLLGKGEFEEVDALLKSVDPSSLSIDILLGLLTSSLPARTKLPSRGDLFIAVEKEVKRRGRWKNGLLSGLEN